jgi:Mrp family chromosome partitioning ATPase
MLDAPAAYVRERLPAVSEAQTNIMLASSGVRTLLLSSPSPSESRTALSVDLADLFGRSGQRVLIVDADFAASFLTRMLAAPSAPHTWTVMSDDARGELWMDFRETPLSNVALLPSYSRANGTPALISSLRWRELVQRLLGTADVIIFDGPAALRGPDAALLAPHVDGVVLVLDPQTDSLEAVENSKARLSRQNGTNLLGAVTFRPSDHEQRRGSLWRRLRGPRLAALPPGPVASAAEDAALPREPIITPPPARAENPAMPRGPIITPAPADDDSANAPPVVPADPGEAAVAAAPARSLAGPAVEPGAGDSAQAEAAPARRAGAPRRSAARTTKPRAPRSTHGERKQQ